MNREARSIRCPESVLGWIPWYAETDERGDWLLDSRQRGAVESHASQCADCRAELDMIAGAPFEIDVELPDPDRVFDEITAGSTPEKPRAPICLRCSPARRPRPMPCRSRTVAR